MTLGDARAWLGGMPLWKLYLCVGALLCGLYLFVPPFAGASPVMNVIGLSPVIAILVGLRCHRPESRGPWRWFALGFVLFWLGDIYTYSYPRLVGREVPFPSIGDAAYVLVYPAIMAGLLTLVRRRNPARDRAGAIDSLIMTLGLALISWLVLIQPSVHADELSVMARLASIAYPVGDIMLLAAAIRLAVDTGTRRPAFYLLAASIVALLATDSVYGVMTLQGDYDGQAWLDVGWISFYVLWGAAALHPSMRELDRPPTASRGSPGSPAAADLRLADGARDRAAAEPRGRSGPQRRQRRRDHPVRTGRDAHGRPRPPTGAVGPARADSQRGRREPGRCDEPRGDLPRRAGGRSRAGRGAV